MARLIRFAPQLGHWLTQHLDLGQSPESLEETMRRQGMPKHAAMAVMAAYVDARRRGVAPPAESVELPQEMPGPARARLPPGTRLDAGDREVLVHMRTDDPVCAALGNVLDADECRQLIALAQPRLAPSTLVDVTSGQSVVSDKRASWGMFFRLEENEFIARIDRRLSRLMNLPIENGEGLQSCTTATARAATRTSTTCNPPMRPTATRCRAAARG